MWFHSSNYCAITNGIVDRPALNMAAFPFPRLNHLILLVGDVGFEPTASGSGDQRSIQLS